MRNIVIAFCALVTLLSVTSCKKGPYASEFEESYKAWIKFKTESQNSYNYSIITGSLSGVTTETIIYVQNGKVVKRSFRATSEHAGPPVVVQEEWIEEGSSLNTHQTGAPTKTLDQVYAEAESNWLKKRDNAQTYFETKNDGMISLVGYEEDGCQDDCFRGITIGFIAKIQY